MEAGDRLAGEVDGLDSGKRAAVRAEIDRLLSAPAFASSLRRGQLLRYLVERTLAGEAAGINEYAIGVDVFEKPPSFDPRIESIVRTEAGRLRHKLREYYAVEGQQDNVLIEIPLRSYKPVFIFRATELVAATPPPAGGRRRQAILVAALALALAGVALAIWRAANPGNRPMHALVVLPFQNLSQNQNDEYLSDGLTDELTNEFANWKDLRVVARTSAYQYKGKGIDVRKIGQELNVDAIIEGSLARQGDHIRITAQLNRTSDGYHLWSHAYDARSDDVLSVQREIAQAIAGAVRKLGGKPPVAVSYPTTSNPEALDLYLRASYEYARLTPASVADSQNLFRAVIEKDQSYERAYVGLAAAELEATNFAPNEGATARARAAVEEALRLDPDSGDAHGLLALLANQDGDWPLAEREFQLAIEKGAQASTRASYGWTLAMHGRFREAQTQCTAAENAEPLGVAPRFCQFYVFYIQRRSADARTTLRKTLDLNPNLIYAHSMLGLVAVLEKNCAEAAAQFEWSASRLPPPAAIVGRAYESACCGDSERARQYLREAARSDPPARFDELARGYAMLHDNEAALACLGKSTALRGNLPMLLHEPFFDGMRADPRYAALEKTTGLAP